MTLDRILSSNPVNATASRVTSKGIHWESQNPPPEYHWHSDAPPKLKPVGGNGSPLFVDLTGVRQGRLTVIGYLGKLNPKASARWLVRCDCGDYEARSARAIKQHRGNDEACCWNCDHLLKIKAGHWKPKEAA